MRFDLDWRETALLDRTPQQREVGFATGLEHHAGNAGLELEADRLNMFDALDRALDAMASERSVGAADVNARIRRCRVDPQAGPGSLIRRLASKLSSRNHGRQKYCDGEGSCHGVSVYTECVVLCREPLRETKKHLCSAAESGKIGMTLSLCTYLGCRRVTDHQGFMQC